MRKNEIYVLGSINVDLVITADVLPDQGETIRGRNFMINAGGKGANQAVAASMLGAKVNMIGAVGNDEFKDVALNSIKNSGVNILNIKQKPSTTGVAVIIKNNNDNRIILDSGSNFKLNINDLKEGLKNATKNDVFITQFEINEDVLYEGLKMAKEKEMITILNPAPAKIIDDQMYELIDYLVINQSEAKLLTNIYPNNLEDSKKVFEFFKNKGIKNLIVTLGSKGSVYLGEETLYIDSYKIKPIDTTGAGDAFIGSFAYSLINKMSYKEGLNLSNATSALVCLKEGAQKAMPTINEVKIFMKERR